MNVLVACIRAKHHHVSMARHEKSSQPAKTVDDIVKMAIEDSFPGYERPDENNRRADGTQFKAPDYAVLDGQVLIECKSRNAVDDSKLYERLQKIAADQGAPFRGYGRMDLAHVVSSLPDPVGANREIADFIFGQTMKLVQKAKVQFEEYHSVRGKPEHLRILTIADNSQIPGDTAAIEHFIGRKMGGYDRSRDVTGMIDAILLIKEPTLTFDQENSYWFKCLAKRETTEAGLATILSIAAALHRRISHCEPYFEPAHSFKVGRYRPLIV